MATGDVETYHADGKWRNRIEGGDDLPDAYDVRATAVAAGHDEAVRRKVEHIVRDLDVDADLPSGPWPRDAGT
ncbi:DUF2188 domain-containing protein [Nocardioides sp. MAHUQ-72]|uniref:DUF2188 domain-containing protein n=1 Tax=unclassified Nocardioides TaxID=2615069 RepID=UPI0036078E12